ncbi:hypothetical protein V6N13_016858 [Hibiscus sabdariffa]
MVISLLFAYPRPREAAAVRRLVDEARGEKSSVDKDTWWLRRNGSRGWPLTNDVATLDEATWHVGAGEPWVWVALTHGETTRLSVEASWGCLLQLRPLDSAFYILAYYTMCKDLRVALRIV